MTMHMMADAYAAAQAEMAMHILDEAMQRRLQNLNAVSRLLRRLGYQILSEEVSSEESSAPVIRLGQMSALAQTQLMHMADASTRRLNGGVCSASMEGVRVTWMGVAP